MSENANYPIIYMQSTCSIYKYKHKVTCITSKIKNQCTEYAICVLQMSEQEYEYIIRVYYQVIIIWTASASPASCCGDRWSR